ncbi:DUF4177 domain-containing protein [Phaeobacter sp.]|uniref:DUF4177 domain-containing protein n=1 Tax=Phaeobacter sp. TaxID=1902409 RepID=UPI0025CE1234|nr:DUF4177 domain-containing protein [Phaeobacter sp.]
MLRYEYKVVPAPAKGTKAKGVKTPEARFANSIDILLNEMAAEGWEYQRAELLPSEERSGLTGSVTNWRNVLIFRRALPQAAAPAQPDLAAQPTAVAQPVTPQPVTPQRVESQGSGRAQATDTAPLETAPKEPVLTATAGDPLAPEGAVQVPGRGATAMQSDDGVEELSPVSGLTAALKARAGLSADRKEPPAPARTPTDDS